MIIEIIIEIIQSCILNLETEPMIMSLLELSWASPSIGVKIHIYTSKW